MIAKQKLELTWIGKEQRPRLEPRILLEDQSLGYGGDTGKCENMLIHGDNLLALKALQAACESRVKCVFIDPPYNTGSAFEHYEDGIEHSLWLSLMRDRLQILRSLLSNDGSIWITIDDNEVHYLKIICDEIFGRDCFVACCVWRSTDNSNNDARQFSVDHNYILIYSKTRGWSPNKTDGEGKRGHFKNPDNDPRGPYFDGNPLNSPKPRPNLTFDLVGPNGDTIKPPKNGWRWSRETLREKIASGEIRFTQDGKAIRRRTYLADMKGLPPSTLWADLEKTGHNRQAKYELKRLFPEMSNNEVFSTPKPERLMGCILEIATAPGDLVLDSFAGSGTTGASAHKAGRRWIMVELGDHCHTHIIPRLKKVIDGDDPGGITEAVGWKGGGGFRYFTLGPSLITQDEWGRDIISPAYRQNSAMLIEAMCKLHGFTFKPSETHFWLHGQSTERDFIYVTTQPMTKDQVAAISDEVGPERTLLICCGSHRLNDPQQFPNITVEKIPKSVLEKCEWGKDDYSLKIRNLPVADEIPEVIPEAERAEAAAEAPKRKRGRPHKAAKSDLSQASFFDAAEATETK